MASGYKPERPDPVETDVLSDFRGSFDVDRRQKTNGLRPETQRDASENRRTAGREHRLGLEMRLNGVQGWANGDYDQLSERGEICIHKYAEKREGNRVEVYRQPTRGQNS